MNTIKHSVINLRSTNRPRFKKSISIKELIDKRQEKINKHTQTIDLTLLKHLKEFSEENILVQSVDANFCHKFANYLVIQAKLQISSATTYLHKLHAILQDAVYMNYISNNPMPPINRLIPKYIPKERECLNVEEIHRLETAQCPHLITKLAFLFSCYTGLRLSDIETLCWNNIYKQHGIYILSKIQVKTNSQVRVPLSKQALEILKQVKNNNLSKTDKVFSMYSRTTIYSDLREWARNAEINKHITFHISRITFVTLSISAGINMFVISKLCGHKDVKTTQVYVRIIDRTYIDAISMFEKIFRRNKSKQKTKQKVELLL